MQAFNCSHLSLVEDTETCLESSCSDGEIFLASDEECGRASDDSSPHEEGVFYSSDDEQPPAPKRARYNPRRTDVATVLGKRVCRRALSMLMGIGGSTLQRLRDGADVFTNQVRKPLPKHPTLGFTLRGETEKVWEHILMFFYHIYHSVAEVMPTHWHMVKEEGAKQIETPFPEDDPESVNREEYMQRLVNAIGRTLNTFSMDVESQMIGPGTFSGPRRCLQHQNRTDLFYEFLAFCESRGLRKSSYSTFMKVANTIIKPGLRNGHLRFRKPGEHAQCDYCFRARERLREARSMQAKMQEERELMRHRLAQWQDRQCYWQFRAMSQTFSQI